MTLRQVITALTETRADDPNNYVPYRDSKLTCLLRQSLGGNSFCLMIACLNPCDLHIEENLSTLTYASKASYISNKPVKGEDPKLRQIEELKARVAALTDELYKANQTIQFLSNITGQNPDLIKANLGNVDFLDKQIQQKLARPDSGAKKEEDVMSSFRMTNGRSSNSVNNAANETKDAITGRIIQTVNMMKEVLQGNLGLRETIQKQSELIDEQNSEIYQLQIENEDLRERMQVLEDYTGKDSNFELK